MDTHMMVELIGYLGSILVVVAMLMSSVVKLRVINSIGAVIFAVYALIIQSYPTALMNICLVIINIYNLMKLKKTDQHFDLIDGKKTDAFLGYILDYYKDDIRTYFPEWNSKDDKADIAYIICCDAVPAGVLLGQTKAEGVVDIILDYSTPAYRDCSVGRYLYSKLPMYGTHTLTFSKESEKHEQYLKKMGYIKENGIYVKNLG